MAYRAARRDDVLLAACGDRIYDARRAAGMTQKDLARAAGCSQPTVSNLEHGNLNPDLVLLRRLACGLQVPLARLLAGL